MFFVALLIFAVQHNSLSLCGEVVWAINCGGNAHVDINGIAYDVDPLDIGTASNHGLSYVIDRVPMEDQILYQTERYHNDDFSYRIPVPNPGDYVLTLKFSEVWFTNSHEKVFDVYLQDYLPLIKSLDIFDEVGFATAFDVHIPLTIKQNTIAIDSESVPIDGDFFTITFKKLNYDNPKINAISLIKGGLEDVPQLPKLEVKEKDWQEPAMPVEPETEQSPRPARSSPAQNPYESMDSYYILIPIVGTVLAVIPILFCLCKL